LKSILSGPDIHSYKKLSSTVLVIQMTMRFALFMITHRWWSLDGNTGWHHIYNVSKCGSYLLETPIIST